MKKQSNKNKKKKNIKEVEGFLPLPDNVSEDCINSVKSFNLGDFKTARALAKSTLKDSKDKKEIKIVKDILKRTDTDYVVLYIALFALLVVIFIFIWAVTTSNS